LSAVTRRVLPLAAAGLVACVGVAAAALTQGRPGVPVLRDPQANVTLCHATSSEDNPYNQERVDADAVVKPNGHNDHPEDIIPPFDWVDHGGVTHHYPGKNWDAEGQAIWLNGCEILEPEPTPLPVQPFVKCVDANGSTFQAIFGYTNPNQQAVTVAVGSRNSFAPSPTDRGQPTTFQPGTVESAVTVTEDAGSTVIWSVAVGGVTSSAAAIASFPTTCSTEPPPGPTPIDISVSCIDNASGTFSATFAYETATAATIPAGTPQNSFTPPLATPPSQFQPGTHEFTVTGIPNGTSLVWTLTTDVTRTATATDSFATKCTPPPAPQPIQVSVTCIEDRGGTFDVTFGYVNPNAAPVDIPAGPDNNVTVRLARSVGQPTTFAVGSVTNAFTVTGVPAGADVDWSVTYAGTTNVATGNEAFPTRCGVDPPNPPDPYRIGVFVTCVTNQGATFSATFGYANEDTESTTVPIGERNRFFPAPENRGQPTTFEPGTATDAFTVSGIATGTVLTWTLTSDQTRFADARSTFETKCTDEPPPAELVPIGLFVTCVTNHANSYDAVFGYTNDNLAEQIIPLGIANTFLPAPGNRGQPTTFEPGTVRNAVTVTGIPNATSLVWLVQLVQLRAAVATPSFPQKCSEPPRPPEPSPPEPQPPPEPPTPGPPPPDPKPPESGLSATCVLTEGATTTYDAVFGYVNASQQDVTIPVGRSNLVVPAPIDRGQPSVFTPGVVLNAFTVRNVPVNRELTWAVRLPGGEIRSATASAGYPRNCITAPAPPTADLVLTKTVRASQLTAGQRGTYEIHVLNRGPSIALLVRITDVVDPRLELLSASTNRGSSTTSGQRVTCTIAALPPGAPVKVVVAVRARGAGTIRNLATATHSRPDPTPRNNVDSARITVTGRVGGVAPAFTG
jgi:uncharacterized repeat protein (TIGR01451 family)